MKTKQMTKPSLQQVKRKRSLKTVCCVLILIFLTLFQSGTSLFWTHNIDAATAKGGQELAPADKEVPVYYYDYPGSFFGLALAQTFAYSDRFRLGRESSIYGETVEDAIYLLPENQVYPFLQSSLEYDARDYRAVYRAGLVIAADPDRVQSELRSWSDFSYYIREHKDTQVGLFIEPEYILASMGLADPSGENKRFWTDSLSLVAQENNMSIFRGEDTNDAWPLEIITGGLEASSLPEVLLMWDYQAAQLNLKMANSEYIFHVPEEGSLVLEFGLFARGDKAKAVFEKRLNDEGLDLLARSLLFFGYRLADGSYPYDERTLSNPDWYESFKAVRHGYPPALEYGHRQLHLEDYEQFNRKLFRYTAEFKRDVLQESPFFPANAEEENISLSIFLPIFFIWLAIIFFRLDNAAIARSMGMLLFWLFLAITMYFIQMMYSGSEHFEVLSYIRFLPFLGIVDAWFFTGLNLAKSQGMVSKKQSLAAFLLSIVYYIVAVAYIFNDLHGQTFILNPYLEITRLQPLFYVMTVFVLVLWLLGFALLMKCQATVYRLSSFMPLFAFIVLFIANIVYFNTKVSITSGVFDLMNIIGSVIILEISLRVRVIPANIGYIKLFRYSPVNLRLLSDDLKEVYPPERDTISKTDMAAIRRAIKEQTKSRQKGDKHGKNHKKETPGIKVYKEKSKGLIYNISRLSSGFLIWEDDISEILKLKEELSSLTSLYEHQGAMLAQERSIKSQYLSMRYRNRMLESLETSLSRQLTEIRQSLYEIKKSADMKFVRHELGRIKIMVSQCKRKSNLLVRGEEEIELEEVKMILNEALQDASTSNIKGFVVCEGVKNVATDELILIYDYLQFVLQKAVDIENPFLFITLRNSEEALVFQIIFNAGTKLEENFFVMPDYGKDVGSEKNLVKTIEEDNGDFHIRICIKEGP